MKVLFDQGTPVPLRQFLSAPEVATAAELGWSQFSNGELLSHAESNGYECLITTDQNLKHQQDFTGRPIRVVVLLSASWPRIQKKTEEISTALQALSEGGYVEIEV